MAISAIAYLPSAEDAGAPEEAAVRGVRSLDLVAVVREAGGPRGGGLAEALERIAAGEGTTLLVARLGALAGSLRELVAVLDWLAAAGAELVALDVGLDTGTAAGRRTIDVLREIESWESGPRPGRRPRGRPGLTVRTPELGERIAGLREGGLSLQAIADALNADGVPTQRGGAHWRPSSVQAALGYRRPRPPVPGAPPPPPGPPNRPGPHPGRAQERPRPPHGKRPRP